MTHSLARSLTHSLCRDSLTHSLTHSVVAHSLTHSLTQSHLTLTLTHSLSHISTILLLCSNFLSDVALWDSSSFPNSQSFLCCSFTILSSLHLLPTAPLRRNDKQAEARHLHSKATNQHQALERAKILASRHRISKLDSERIYQERTDRSMQVSRDGLPTGA